MQLVDGRVARTGYRDPLSGMGLRSAERTEFEAFVVSTRSRLIRALVGRYGIDRAEDAASAALSWAWQHWDRVRSMANPVGYLYRVAQSKMEPPPSVQLPPPSVVDAPEVELELVGALMQLPDRQRTAVWLCVGCGWTHSEAADAMEISTSAVSTHVARALASLRRTVEGATHVG